MHRYVTGLTHAPGLKRLRVQGRGLLCAGLLAVSAAAAQQSPSWSCDAAIQRAPAGVGRITLLGYSTLTRGDDGPTRHLGGISGLDFEPADQTWWLLSDDKGDHAAPRAYPARGVMGAAGLGNIDIGEPVNLPLFAGEVADPEALRRHPCLGLWAWASEGHVVSGQQPSVRWLRWPAPGPAASSGTGQASSRPAPFALPLGALMLPPSLQAMAATSRGPAIGPRHNRSFEGLAFTPHGDALWVAMEGPLQQDGPEPDTQRGAPLRFTRLPLAGGPAVQHVYPIEPIQRPGTGGRMRADNGVSEILALASGELLVIERNGYETAENRFSFGVRLFLADARDATDVAALQSLVGAEIRPMRKRLLLDLSTLELPQLDNIEAAAWGPRLADGRALLLLVSDDNFARNQVTQLIALAVEDAP